ncbi:MAG: ribonuclease H-like domain-containing protein [Candidatus Omnitrophota bacterium]
MKRIVFDIETAGLDLEDLDNLSQEYLLKNSKTEEEKKIVRESLSFYPLTAEIVAIGMLDIDKDKGVVFFQDPSKKLKVNKDDKFDFVPGNEKEILENFWKEIKDCNQFVTFNGRAFDAPFIMIRSAMHKIKPTKNLMPNRYDSNTHFDLLDRLIFYGAVQRRFNLHMWCKAFGINSPKEEITGHQVKDLFREGRYLDIAKYCTGDLFATRDLYLYWENFIKF